jgi:hypothetical protein
MERRCITLADRTAQAASLWPLGRGVLQVVLCVKAKQCEFPLNWDSLSRCGSCGGMARATSTTGYVMHNARANRHCQLAVCIIYMYALAKVHEFGYILDDHGPAIGPPRAHHCSPRSKHSKQVQGQYPCYPAELLNERMPLETTLDRAVSG